MNLADNLFRSAAKYPDRTAIVFYDRRIRYADLCERVSRLAAALAARGLGPGRRLAVALPNVPEFVIAYYATLAAGAQLIPVNPIYTVREIEYMFSDAKPDIVITHPMFEQAVREAIRDKPIELIYSDNLGDPAKICIADIIKEQTTGMNPVNLDPGETAVVAYTNACQGFPLGAQLTHEGLDFDADACRLVARVDENHAFLTVIPLYHAFSATACMNLPIASGAMTVLQETFSEKRVIETLENEPISIFPTVPTILQRVYDVYGGAGKDLSKIKAFVPGGAPTKVELIQKFSQAFSANIYEGYGVTECGPVTASNLIGEKIAKPGSIGPPILGESVKIIDENDNELPSGDQGEVCFKGPNVMKGYLNQPEMTDKYLKNGWFHTGDRAWIDNDGFIFITGLIKRMILVGGFNVYPAEVEKVLKEHPSVDDCTIFGIDDAIMGSRVVAEVKLRPGFQLTQIELKKYLRKGLAPYKVPKIINFV